MKQSLEKTISISELQRLRAERGLSNAEIAEMLDVSVATVYKYLGPAKAPHKPKTTHTQPVEPRPAASPLSLAVRVFMPSGYVDFKDTTFTAEGDRYVLKRRGSDGVVAVFTASQVYGVAMVDWIKEE